MIENHNGTLQYISDQLNRYVALIIFIFGVFGNTLNCLILSQSTMRSNPCALLFLTSSFVSLVSILIGIPTRILNSWNQDPTSTINWACKARAFIVFSTRTMGIWLITLATIDRWLISSRNIHHRQLSTLKNTKRAIFMVVMISALLYSHMLFCYEANIIDGPLKCYGKSPECCLTTDLIYSILTILIPLCLMTVFGLIIISHVRHLHTRVHIVTHVSGNLPSKHTESKFKKTDHHLIHMLLIQIIFLIIFCVPQAIQKFYFSFRPSSLTDPGQYDLSLFLYNIEIIFAFIASGMPFYIYTISGGTVFRKASADFMNKLCRKLAR